MIGLSWPDTKAVIAILVILCTIGIAVVLLMHPVLTDSPMLNIVVGGWIAYGTTVIQYYFGSSQGSKIKDEALAQIASQKGDPT